MPAVPLASVHYNFPLGPLQKNFPLFPPTGYHPYLLILGASKEGDSSTGHLFVW